MRENRPYGLEGGESAKRTSLPLCAPVKAIEQLGESPDRGFCYIPVVNGNCVFKRKGGEQPETKEQSVIPMNSIRPSLSGSVRAMREPLTARYVPDEARLRAAE